MKRLSDQYKCIIDMKNYLQRSLKISIPPPYNLEYMAVIKKYISKITITLVYNAIHTESFPVVVQGVLVQEEVV